MEIKIIYEDDSLMVVDKPASIIVFPEGNIKEKTLIDYLVEKNPELKKTGEPPRYGIVHRLDKDTSGILLIAKDEKSLIFLQKQFINRDVQKKYIALATGTVKKDSEEIRTLIGRSPSDYRKQKAYLLKDARDKIKDTKTEREAITEYKVLQRFENYTLLEVEIKTGRKHQIRCHLSYIHHPITGDKLYGFKDSPTPIGLNRQFLHASYIKIKLPNGSEKEFASELPDDLQSVLDNLKIKNQNEK